MVLPEGCLNGVNPHAGAVLPQMVSTGVPVREARCWLAESMLTITSRRLMVANSSVIGILPASDTHPGYFSCHESSVWASCPFPPKRYTRKPRAQSIFTTCSMASGGYVLVAYRANGAMPTAGCCISMLCP